MDRFEICYARVRKSEGGWSDRPLKDDPGGKTMWGVTQGTYDNWRRAQGQPTQTVRKITAEEAHAIYRAWFWNKAGEGLPVGLDYAVFDYGVNSGPGRAIGELQRLLGVKDDGLIGPQTLAAAHAVEDQDVLIARLTAARLRYVRGLRNYRANPGWEPRIAGVQKAAQAEARGSVGDFIPEVVAPGKAPPEAKSAARTALEVVTDKDTLATIGGVVGSAGALASGSGPIQWALAAVLVLAAVTGAVLLLRRAKA